MKTLKKTLCLVLAVVLVVGTLILPAAADNAAAAPEVDADAKAAFETLHNYDVIKGVDKDSTPDYDSDVTRAEVAAIVYRIMTGDTLDTMVANYASKADVYNDKAAIPAWAKGYVGYVTDKGIFGGDEKGNFNANSPVTGVQLVKVLLCCIGYGQNHEFEGKDWAKNTLATAGDTNLFGSVGTFATTGYYPVKIDTGIACKRGNVFKLTYNAVKVPRVTYFAGAYSNHYDVGRPNLNNNQGSVINTSLITDNLTGGVVSATYDGWGIPTVHTTAKVLEVKFNNPVKQVVKNVETVAKTDVSNALYDSFRDTSTNPVGFEDWCDIAKWVGAKTNSVMKVYVNGTAKANQTLYVLDEDNGIPTRGRHTLIYANPGADKTTIPYIMVQIDTYLAQVTNLASSNPDLDKNGHVINPNSTANSVAVYEAGAIKYTDSTNVVLPADTKLGAWVLVNYCEALDTTGAVIGALADPTVTEKTICVPNYALGVTIKEITKNAAGDYVGFVDSTGKQYYYSNTLNMVAGSAIKEDSIGKVTYNLTLDKQGFVLSFAKVSTTDANFGVVLSRSIVTSDDGYKIKVTLLNAKGEKVEVTLGQPGSNGDYYTDKDVAQIDLNAHLAVGNLIHYTTAAKGYTFDRAANLDDTTKRPLIDNTHNKIVPGRVDILDTYGNDFIRGNEQAQGFLVNDDTVVFVAQNVIDNTTLDDLNDYKFTGNYLITNFKSMPTLTVEDDASKITGMAGQTIDPDYLSIQALKADGNAPTAGQYAKYVVINGSTKQITTPETISEIQYAFIFGNSAQKQVGDSYFIFNAFIDGKPSTITVSLNAANNIKTNGLYAYGTAVNVNGTNAYTEVILLDSTSTLDSPYDESFKIAKNGYTYSKGVLTDTAKGLYYNVAANCQVFGVAPTAHESHAVEGGISNLMVFAGHDIWYQVDKTGTIVLIYIDMSTAN